MATKTKAAGTSGKNTLSAGSGDPPSDGTLGGGGGKGGGKGGRGSKGKPKK